MIHKTLVLGILLIFFTGTGYSQNITKSPVPKLPINANVTNAIGDAIGALSKLLGTGNAQGTAGIVQTIEGLLHGAATKGNLQNGLMGLGNNTGGNAIGDAVGAFSKLLGTGNAQGTAGIVQTIEGLLQGAATKGNLQNGLMGNKTGGNLDFMSMLAPLLPLLSNTGFTDPTKLIPMALGYLTSNINSLKAKGVSETCRNDLQMWVTGLAQTKGWAWKMIDSGFKIPSNLAGFNLKWMGDMGECTGIHANAYNNNTHRMQEFDGKYCRLLLPVTGIPGAGYQMMVLGSCASSHCSNSDVKVIVDTVIEAITPKAFTSRSIVSCVEEKELDSKAVAVVCFLAILGAVVAFATLYDIISIQMTPEDDELKSYNVSENNGIQMSHMYTNGSYAVTEVEKGPLPVKQEVGIPVPNGVITTANIIVNKPKTEKSRLVKALLAFSAYSNACKLLGTSQASGSLGAINGIRFLSMAWVILGHTYFFALNYTSNLADFGKKKANQYSFMAILYATPSVDSFFALSGCLVAYLTLRELKKVGGARKLNWFMFYFHRFWRLTPPYMLIILVGTILYRYIGNGALKPDGDNPFMAPCRDNWWTNLLYINNFAKTDKLCMGWTWYLANDMQMYILSPLILLPLFYNVIVGGVVSGVFMVATIITTAVISHEHEYPVQTASEFAPTKQDSHYNDLMYIPFYTRIGPYIVGLLTGYALYKCECKFKIPKVINLGCWFLCILITTLIIYGPYTKDDSHIFTTGASTAYYTLFRTAWGVAICWIIFTCATGNSGWVNDILSWSPYVPLGRLTYCAYLLHPLVMMMFYENRMQPVYFTDYDTVYFFLGNLVLSYGAAFVISLFFESPMMGLEKAIFKKN